MSSTKITAAVLLILVFVLVTLLPAAVLGALVSVIFSIGYWNAFLYVAGGWVGLRIVGHSIAAAVRR